MKKTYEPLRHFTRSDWARFPRWKEYLLGTVIVVALALGCAAAAAESMDLTLIELLSRYFTSTDQTAPNP